MIFVVFPAFNEERVIRPTLAALSRAMAGKGADYRAVLVDDGSSDRTVEEALQAQRESGGTLPLTVLRHEENRGLGAGLRTGISWCLEHAQVADAIVTLDADGTHPPDLIPELAARLGDGYDLVIASRYRPGAVVTGVPPHRLALSGVGRLLFQSLFYFPGVRDYTCCFRAFRVPPLRAAQQVYGDEFLTAQGFEAVMDLLLRMRQLGVRATEIPIRLDYSGRVGLSKMKVLRTIRTTLSLLARRFVERFTRFSPDRVRAILEAQSGR